MTDELRKAELIKKALKIVDELAKIDYDFYADGEDIEDLIEQAQKLKKDRLWKLK